VGLVSLVSALGVTDWPEVKPYLDQMPTLLAELQSKLPKRLEFLKEVLTVQGLWFTGSIVAIVFGIYGFSPKSRKWRKPKKISYTGPHGEVQIQLDTVEQSLNHVLARMPEVKRINVKVDPQDGGRRALIRAEVVLYQRPGQNARALASLVTDYIAETASKLVGLEDLATIELKVTGIVVNSKKSSQAIRKESLSHSAPVELLEAPPAPLTLSGPREPIGSGPIEQELEDSNADAMETSAVDTLHEVSNQAAARSELLEPLHVSKPASVEVGAFHTEGGQDDRLGESQEAVIVTAQSDEPAYTSSTSVNAVAPLEMDVLDEPLSHDNDVHYAEVESDEAEESPYRSEVTSGIADEAVEGALDDDPAYGGTLAGEDDAVVEETDAEDHTPVQDGHEDELATEDQGHDSGVEGGEEYTGDVTIPEGDDDPNNAGKEKKRWGWFN
jgi:hypothetical protein